MSSVQYITRPITWQVHNDGISADGYVNGQHVGWIRKHSDSRKFTLSLLQIERMKLDNLEDAIANADAFFEEIILSHFISDKCEITMPGYSTRSDRQYKVRR